MAATACGAATSVARHRRSPSLPAVVGLRLRRRQEEERMAEEEQFLAVAVDAAKSAGEIIHKGFYETKNVEHKGQVDLVTETDKACEDLIFNHLRKHYPDHKFIGEDPPPAALPGPGRPTHTMLARHLMIIMLSASANKLSRLKEQAEEYAALIMEELDPEGLGYIELFHASGWHSI